MGRFLFLHGFGESSLVASMSAEALGNFLKSKGVRLRGIPVIYNVSLFLRESCHYA